MKRHANLKFCGITLALAIYFGGVGQPGAEIDNRQARQENCHQASD